MVKPRPMHKKNGLLLAEMMRNGYTINSLAKATGVHYLTIWRIVNQEHKPCVDTAAKLAEILNVDLKNLGIDIWGEGAVQSGKS